MSNITEEQWTRFNRFGYLKLGRVLTDYELRVIQDEIDAIMLGEAHVDYDRMMMQLDGTTGHAKDAGAKTKGFKQASLGYRKIEDLEYDPVFLDYIQRPIFRDCCERVYGIGTPISIYRAMFFNKPAYGGSRLAWHQDWFGSLGRDPRLTVWTALDPATRESGCVKVVPGSHREKLAHPQRISPFISDEQVAKCCPDDKVVYLEVEAGEVLLLNNYLLHASDVTTNGRSRRAFSVCYMEGNTRNEKTGDTYPVAFGKNAMTLAG
jgi:hypothetical protein